MNCNLFEASPSLAWLSNGHDICIRKLSISDKAELKIQSNPASPKPVLYIPLKCGRQSCSPTALCDGTVFGNAIVCHLARHELTSVMQPLQIKINRKARMNASACLLESASRSSVRELPQTKENDRSASILACCRQTMSQWEETVCGYQPVVQGRSTRSIQMGSFGTLQLRDPEDRKHLRGTASAHKTLQLDGEHYSAYTAALAYTGVSNTFEQESSLEYKQHSSTCTH